MVASLAAALNAISSSRRIASLLGPQVGFRDDGADLLLQFLDMRLQPAYLHQSLEHHPQLAGRERLGQIIERAAPHGLDRRLDGGVSGHDDDRQSRGQPQQAGDRIEPASRPAADRESAIEQALAEQILGVGAAVGFGDGVAQGFQRQAKRLAQAGIVVNEKNVHGVSRSALSR